MFAPFRLTTASADASQPLVGEFAAAGDSVVIAAELMDDATALLLCRCTRLIREDDGRESLIRRVDRCRTARLVRITLH